MTTIRFDQRVAVITGAGGGLGRSYALEFARRGAKVIVNDLGGSIDGKGSSGAVADKVVEEIKAFGGKAVANYDSVEKGEKIIQTALDHYGRVDILINNAGILRDVSFKKMCDEDWDLIYRVHTLGAYKVTRAAWGYMQEQQFGRIVNTASAAGIYGNFGQANYSAAKLGLVGLTNTLAIEGANKNICVNVIAPIAGSRLLETVSSAEMIAVLKPGLVTPLVIKLCAEENTENGSLFEVGAGWMAKLRWQRSKGAFFDAKLDLSAENVVENWDQICSFDEPDYPDNVLESAAPIFANLGEPLENVQD